MSRRAGRNKVAHLRGKLVVQGSASSWGEAKVGVAPKADDFAAVQDEVLKSISAQIKAFKRGQAVVLAVGSEKAKFAIGPHHEVLGQLHVEIAGELELVVLDKPVLFVSSQLAIVASVEQRNRRRCLHVERQAGSARWENGKVAVVAPQGKVVGHRIGNTGFEHVRTKGVVVDVKSSVLNGMVEREVIVGPF